MAYTFSIHPDLIGDLERIKKRDLVLWARLAEAIQELRCSQALLDKLLTDHHDKKGQGDFHVRRWVAQWNSNDLWRVKWWNLEQPECKYRLIYQYEWRVRKFNAAALVNKQAPDHFDYQDDHPITHRVRRAIAS